MLSVLAGSTSITVNVMIYDSSVTTGAGLTGLAFNTAGLVASYVRPRAARQAITLATQTAAGAFSSGGFAEIDSTNMPGLYRLDIPDAALASGVRFVDVYLKGATNMAPVVLQVELTAVDNQDAAAFGLSRLDAAITTRLATAGYTAPSNSAIAAIQAKTDTLPASPANEATLTTIAGYIDTEVAAIKAKTDNLPASPAATGDAMALTTAERNSVADATLDRANGIETGLTLRQALRLISAVLVGKLTGAATTTVTMRNAVADSKARVTATVDADGNRSAITTDLT